MKTTIKVVEVLQLNNELLEIQKESEIKFTVKYDLVKLQRKTGDLVKIYIAARKELIERYGEENKEGIFALTGSGKKEGEAELEKLNEKKEEFTERFKMSDFKHLKTGSPYIILMNFIDIKK